MPTFDELVGQLSDRLSRSGQEEEESQGSSSLFFQRLTTGTSTADARPIAVDSFNNLSWRYMDDTEYPSLRQRGYRAFESTLNRYASELGLSTRRTREERTTNMHISIKPPELTAEKRQQLTDFYSLVLRQGFANWPLREREAVLWIDGRARVIKTYSEWSLTEEHLYIGYSYDRGQAHMSDPILRLATVTALMAMTGHTGNPTLMGLVEQRLSAILAGNYQTAVAALGQRPDGRPVEQIAWSTIQGLAARLGDEWVRPLTGEPVAVGAGWVVLEVPKQQAVAVGGEAGVSQGSQTAVRTLQEFAEARGFVSRTLSDGRYALAFGEEERAREVLADAVRFGCSSLVVDQDNRYYTWVVTTPSTLPPALSTDPFDPF